MIALLHPLALMLSAGLCAYAARRDLRVPLAASGSCLALVAALAFWTANASGYDWRAVSTIAMLLLACGLIAEIDRRFHLIPDVLVVAIVVLAIGAPSFAPVAGVAGAAATGSMFLLVRWLFARAGAPDALGLGDVKLAAAMGLFLGPTPALIAVAVAAGATAALIAARVALSPSPTRGAPFGVGLAAALFVTALHQAVAP